MKQNKGKDLHKVPKSKLKDTFYYTSIKYDGFYVQIKKEGSHITMTTSGGKEFYIAGLADYINRHFNFNFHIECEYNHNCEGMLGDRGLSAILTTYRTNFVKGIVTEGDPVKDTFRILDMLDMPNQQFRYRLGRIHAKFYAHDWFMIPNQVLVPLAKAKWLAKTWKDMGYEGAMCKDQDHMYQPGKRTNDIIKIKPRLTADLVCIGTKPGTGKYEDMIGSLELEDSEGRTVFVGSGLNDSERGMTSDWFIDCVYEIEYERIDTTYIQPIIKHRREDKSVEEID